MRKRRRPDGPVALEDPARARYDPTGDASRASRDPLPYSESERETRVTRNRRRLTLNLFCLAEILA